MNYHGVYEHLMRRAYLRGDNIADCYFEVHHVIPRSLDGSEHPDNLVKLTYREHFLAHWLLSKMFSGEAARKMAFALHCTVQPIGKRRIASWRFKIVKRAVKAQALDTREKRRQFELKLKETRLLKEANFLIDKEENGAINANEFLRLEKLRSKHRSGLKIVRGRRVCDPIGYLLRGREVDCFEKKVKRLGVGQMVQRVQGTVKFFNRDKGYGFLARSDGGQDVFVHITDLPNGVGNLDQDQKVSFAVVASDRKNKGNKAVDLKLE